MFDDLRRAILARRAALIGLTQALIRVPTINPPGENYREACEVVARHLQPLGFETRFLRATGTPGDSERHPRWNLVAWREGTRPGRCVHFNGHIDVVEVGHGWTVDPFGGDVGRRQHGEHARHRASGRRIEAGDERLGMR